MPPADAGSGHIFVANEGLTALATIMPPTFVGSEFRSADATPTLLQFPIYRMRKPAVYPPSKRKKNHLRESQVFLFTGEAKAEHKIIILHSDF